MTTDPTPFDWAIGESIQDITAPLAPAVPDELARAKDLLREWRDKYEASERHTFKAGGAIGASPSDLLRETQRLLEGKPR